MQISTGFKCQYCIQIFCCENCCMKHENKEHAEIMDTVMKKQSVEKVINCYICDGSPFPLQKDLPGHLLDHINALHLPLRCNKCCKIFKNGKDLKQFDKCIAINENCKLQIHLSGDNKENESDHLQKHTDKIQSKLVNLNYESESELLLTPNTQCNENLNQKTNAGIRSCDTSTDGASSIRNMSSINYSTGYKTASPTQLSAKIVRQTSTPMHQHVIALPCGRNMIGKPLGDLLLTSTSSCQISSICGSSSESDISPPIILNTSSSKKLVRPRHKMSVAATPLRQIMSKSIQRALAQHASEVVNNSKVAKPLFINNSSKDSLSQSCVGSPLDLRTSPVKRRTISELSTSQNSSDDSKTNSIVTQKFSSTTKQSVAMFTQISFTNLDTVYETCQTLDNISEERDNLEKEILNGSNNVEVYQTPKSGGNLKRSLSFAERNDAMKASTPNRSEDEFSDDVWYTPSALPIRSYSCSDVPISTSNVNKNTFGPRKNDSPDKQSLEGKNSRHPWTILSSVFQLAFFNKHSAKEESGDKVCTKPNDIKESANSSCIQSDYKEKIPTIKRKRSLTLNIETDSIDIRKMKRIRGRKPIERMRTAL